MDWGTILQAVSAASSTYGKQQQGAAQGAAQQANLQQGQDQNALANYIARQNEQNSAANLDLQRQQDTRSARGKNAKDAIIGALMGGFQPHDGSRGITAAMSSPEAKAAMMELNRQGLEAQFAPPSYTGGSVLTAPTQTPLPKVGGPSWLSTLASLAQIAGTASPYLKKSGGGGNGDFGGET